MADTNTENIEFSKEYWQLRNTKQTPGKVFEFAAHQLFTSFYVNPYSPHKRVHNKSGTGLGKTILALKCVKQFLDMGRSVFILGFQETRFIDELLHQPELGFVTHEEVAKLVALERDLAHNSAEVKKAYSEYRSRLKSRLKRINFYGYKLFAIRMFDMSYTTNAGEFVRRVNFDFIKSMRHGLIVCDESQEAYNSLEKNNWGNSIQLAINLLGPDVHLLTMSATPFLTSDEIREFMSLLIETPRFNIRKIQYGMNQAEQNAIVDSIINFTHPDIAHLRIPADITPEVIEDNLRGKILYTPDIGIDSLPSKEYVGVSINGIDYLKFTIVPMSKHQQMAVIASPHNHQLRHLGGFIPAFGAFNGVQSIDTKRSTAVISPIGEGADDDIIDDGEGNDSVVISTEQQAIISHTISYTEEVFRSEIETIQSFKYAAFCEAEGINVIKTNDGLYLAGEFLQREYIAKYSPKYAKVLDIIEESRHTRGGKILIYSYDVHGVGVLTIEQVMLQNGIISTDSIVNEYTRCSRCYKQKKEHSVADVPGSKCEFNPMRFVSIHSKTSANSIRNIMTRYRARDNMYGDDITILIGSRKITVGTDIDCIRTEIITSLPVSIPLLIQLFGRVARSHSHSKLEPDQRNVSIYILVSAFNEEFDRGGKASVLDSPEITNYRDRMVDYLRIQRYGQVIDRIAVDAYIQDTDKLIKENNKKLAATEGIEYDGVKFLGPLSFDLPSKPLPTGDEEVDKVKYVAYNYNKYEMTTITVLMGNAFAESKIWDIEQLWEYILSSRGTPNPAQFSKESYVMCLQSYPALTILDRYVINIAKVDVDGFSRIDHVRSYKKMKYSYASVINDLKREIEELVSDFNKRQVILQLVHTYTLYEKYKLSIHLRLLEDIIMNDEAVSKGNRQSHLVFYGTLFELLTKKFMRVTNVPGPDTRVIGYRLHNSYKYLVSNAKQQLSYKTTATGVSFVDNRIITGMYDKDMTFKLIKSVNEKFTDVRKIPRGIVCSSMSKTELVSIADKLGVAYDSSNISNLCKLIKAKLIENETKKAQGMKWFWLQPVWSS